MAYNNQRKSNLNQSIMQPLTIHELSFSYPNSAATILQNITLEFHVGWSAIVGANGCGKSTLLRLIAKELSPQEGTIKGNNLVYYCHQSTEDEPQEFGEFMMTYSSKAFKIRDSLEIKDEWLAMWSSLSHGQRKRVQIAIALFMEPDVLLLDEPTNHLDTPSKKIVFEALKSFKGVGILVSHDRALLDGLCTNTIILKNAKSFLFRSNYSTAIHEYKQNLNHLANSQQMRDQEMKKLKNLMLTQEAKVLQSKQKFSKKRVGIHDSDARAKINLAKLTGKDKNDGQVLKQAATKYKHLQDSSVGVEKIYKQGISFETQSVKKLFPLFIKKGVLQIHEKQSVLFGNMQIQEGDKIGVIGENGAGKSSFIDYLLQTLELKEAFFYIPQEITTQQSQRLFQEINELPKEQKGEIFTIITRLASNPKILLESSSPSPGEIRKLLLAQALLKQPNLIILDEPTNHMDLDSILALENALREYAGALILVSHDELFLQNITSKSWSFEKKDDESYEIKEISL